MVKKGVDWIVETPVDWIVKTPGDPRHALHGTFDAVEVLLLLCPGHGMELVVPRVEGVVGPAYQLGWLISWYFWAYRAVEMDQKVLVLRLRGWVDWTISPE
mgnify:CR=1 FL=1